MILQKIIELGYYWFNAILDTMADIPVYSAFSYIIQGVGAVWGYLDSFIIISDVLAVIAFVFIVDNVAFTLRVLKFIKSMIPFL